MCPSSHLAYQTTEYCSPYKEEGRWPRPGRRLIPSRVARAGPPRVCRVRAAGGVGVRPVACGLDQTRNFSLSPPDTDPEDI